jgi:hypothetical protein
MDESQTQSGQTGTGPAKAVSQLSESLAQTAENQRVLIQEFTSFAKDEGRRFFNLRLERNAQALNKLQNCHGIPGLIGVQQEWIRDLVEDYMGQNLRLAGTMRDLTQNVMASATETASGHIDRMQQDASDIVHHAGEQINQMAQSVNEHAPETQH